MHITTAHIPPEVAALAKEHGVSEYLPAILAMLQQVLVGARRIDVLVDEDPEIPDDRHIVFEIGLPCQDVNDYLRAKDALDEGLIRVCPPSQATVFRLSLTDVEP